METLKLDIISGEYEKAVAEAAKILKEEGIVAIPTETVYGLAASAYSDNAIKKVFEAKGRPQDNPLIVHISDMEMLSQVARDVPESAYILAEKFWPGPLTIILPKGEKIAESVSAGLSTVAVRMPSSVAARDIIKKSGLPLAAPSANISGSPSPTTAQHVISDLSGRIDAIVLGEDCEVGVESTVVSLAGENPSILRPGAVTAEDIEKVLGEVAIDKAVLNEPQKNEKVASPGMKYKHYAPKTEAFLIEGESKPFADFVNFKFDALAICFTEDADLINIEKLIYGSLSDDSSLAHNLFASLRKADELEKSCVYIHAPKKSGVGLAVYNRLIRAAAFRVIKL